MPATYEPIATTTLGSATAEITFSSIPATYTDLVITLVGTTTAGNDLNIRINGDTGTNYSNTYIQGDGTSAVSSRDTGATFIKYSTSSTSTTIPFFTKIDIFSYAGSTNKTVLININGDTNGGGEIVNTVGLWRSTAAITSVTLRTFSTTFKTGTTATLYGILKA